MFGGHSSVGNSAMIACIIGLGSIGRRYAKILNLLNIKFDVVSSGKGSLTQSVNTQILQDQVGFRQYFKTLDEAIINTEYDFWIVATPSVFHSEQGAQLLSKGQNVFLEKPVAVNSEGIELLKFKLKAYKGIAGVAYTLRAHPYVRNLSRIIKEKRFGVAISASVVWSSYLPSWHSWEDYKTGYVARPEMGGGVTFTCSHEIDLILFLFGNLSKFSTSVSSSSHLNIPVDDCLDALFVFQSGLSCNLHLDLFQKKPRRTLEVLFDHGYIQIDFIKHSLEIYGDEISVKSLGNDISDIWSTIYQYQVSNYVGTVNNVCAKERLFATLSEGLQVASISNQIIAGNYNV